LVTSQAAVRSHLPNAHEPPECRASDCACAERDARRAAGALSAPAREETPVTADPKQPVSLRLDVDVIHHFRRSGRGWQSRIDMMLRKAAKLPAEKTEKRKKA
jgi:uncharacterized protein (DUF4415 family)